MGHHRITLSGSCVQPRPAGPGFSLLELVLVLVVLAVLGAVAAPRYAGANARYRADFAAQRIAADLRLAQRAARASGSAAVVTFDTANHLYQLTGVDAMDGSGTYAVNLQVSPYQSRLSTATFGADSTLTFNGWGVPDSNGVVVIQVGSETRTIALNQLSGKVTIQ